MVNATNGTDCHTMMIVRTMKNDQGFSSQEWFVQFSVPVRVLSMELTRPYSVSKIHPHTTVAVRGGIAHATSRPIDTTIRHARLSRTMRTATRMPRLRFSTVSTIMIPRLRMSAAGKSDFVNRST